MALLAVGVAGASCVGQIGDNEIGDGPSGSINGFEPPAPSMRRLLARQYVHSIEDLLGTQAADAALAPVDTPLNGFDAIGASQLNIGDAAVVDYEKSARAAASAAVSSGAKIGDYLTCEPSGPTDDACLETFIRNFGRLAFRRSLTTEEVTGLVTVGAAAADAYGTFDAALEYAIATMLQSPSFVYQIEVGGPPVDGVSILTGLEMASRLSFFLLDTTPSAELLDRAEAGDLDDPEGVRLVAEELVSRPEARRSLAAMYDEILNLRGLSTIAKSPDLFPEFSPELVASMRQETLKLLENIVWDRDADFTEFFTSDRTFVDAHLAELYGLPAPADGEWEEVTLPAEQPRAGFFGQASFLASQAHIELTSPTLRGKFVRERLLCTSINPPPNDVVTEFPDDAGLKTMRERLQVHQENPSCAACHALTDNIGLSFENFDAIGRFRLTENDVTIDPSGTLEGASFADGEELADLVASDPAFIDCAVRNIYRASLGRIEGDGEERVVDELVSRFESSDRRVQALLVEIAVSDAFRFVGVEP